MPGSVIAARVAVMLRRAMIMTRVALYEPQRNMLVYEH